MGFASRMKKYKAEWSEGKASSLTDPADVAKALGIKKGDQKKFIAKLLKAVASEDDDNNPKVLFEYAIDSDSGPVTVFRSHVIKSGGKLSLGQKLGFMFQDIRRFGYDIDDMTVEDVESVCAELTEANPEVNITLKFNGEYLNTRLIGLNEPEEEEEEADGEEPEEDEDEADGEEADEDEADEDEADEDEADEDEADGEEEAVGIGSTVKYKPKGAPRPKAYTVISIKDDKATIQDRDGKKLTVALNALAAE